MMKDSRKIDLDPNIGEVARTLSILLNAFGQSRKADDLTAEDILIFLAIGQQSLAKSPYGLIIQPTTCVDVGKILGIPRETVRRRVNRLIEMDLVESGGRGIRLLDIGTWQDLALKFSFGSSTPNRT